MLESFFNTVAEPAESAILINEGSKTGASLRNLQNF